MTTFILKKYEPKKEENIISNIDEEEKKKENDDILEEIKITSDSSISGIISKLLYKKLPNNIEIKVGEEKNSEENSIKAISTENINKNPLKTFNSINKNDTVFILNKGFKTSCEEWFLTNIENKTSNIIYTEEKFISYIKEKLGI